MHDVFGHWTLSKGKIGDNPTIANETLEEGTIREVKEEIGVDIKIEQKYSEKMKEIKIKNYKKKKKRKSWMN